MSGDKVLQAMRAQAWERAKGELAAIQQADFPPSDGYKEDRKKWDEKCRRRQGLMEKFIYDMEQEELYL